MTTGESKKMMLTRLVGILLAGAAIAVVGWGWSVMSAVDQALHAPSEDERPLQWLPVVTSGRPSQVIGGRRFRDVAHWQGRLVASGDFGVRQAEAAENLGPLPSMAVGRVVIWKGTLLAAPSLGGLARWNGGRWQVASSDWGRLEVRDLLPTIGGELWIAARQGLFRTGYPGRTLVRVHDRPVRCLARGAGVVYAGGESGLVGVHGRRVERLSSDWVEWVGVVEGRLWTRTAKQLETTDDEGRLIPVEGSLGVDASAIHGASVHGRIGDRLVRWGADLTAEGLGTVPVRGNLRAVGDELYLAGPDQLMRWEGGRWSVHSESSPRDLPSAHVNALCATESVLWVGAFDGGVARGLSTPDGLSFELLEDDAVWGVNALSEVHGELWIASLRGAARWDGGSFAPVEGSGAAFALSSTRQGMAIGLSTGVLLPQSRLLSGFHGLPGNQVLALHEEEALWVGTPSGLGLVSGERVVWAAAAGDGVLPHSWVTSLTADDSGVWIGTYGGGVARARRAASGVEVEVFEETAGMKVNPHCVTTAPGVVVVGLDGGGLLALREGDERFRPVRVDLPSPRVTALERQGDDLWVGTDQGLARLSLRGVLTS